MTIPVNAAYFELVDAFVALLLGASPDGTVTLTTNGVDGKPINYTVSDGPPTSDDFPPYAVFVGWDGDPEGDYQAVATNQDWAGLGARRRNETDEIVCCLVAEYGDGDGWKPARDIGLAIQQDVETKLREHPDLGLTPNGVRQVIQAEFKPTGVFQEPDSETGFQFRVAFTVSVETRI
jgi:hypothetical protein